MDEPRATYRTLLCRTGEVWLKGANRKAFLDRLRKNLAASLKVEMKGVVVRVPFARLYVDLPEGASLVRAIEICQDTPGVEQVLPIIPVEPELADIEAKALALVEQEWAGRPGSFRVRARRADKRFPMKSPELAGLIGSRIAEIHGFPVDLRTPDRTLLIDITNRGCFVAAHRYAGLAGLPIGSAGRVMLLLSGGIDSPVAGYLAQKRGCEVEAVYFHSPPFISEASRDKVVDLARRLAPRQGGLRLFVVHFAGIQQIIRDAGGDRFTVLLYRRFMYRIAAALARRRRAEALCTGESLGQVASQTMTNLRAVDQVTDMLTLRPLITTAKGEIISIAKKIGTYETSVLPHDDCCTLFVPEHPATRAPLPLLERWEQRVDVDAMVAGALEQVEVVKV